MCGTTTKIPANNNIHIRGVYMQQKYNVNCKIEEAD